MNLKDIKALYRFLKDTDIVEVELEGPDGKLRLKRGAAEGAAPPSVVAAPAAVPAPETSAAKEPEHIKLVTAPMVGTFYRAPSPEAPSFVEVGADVKPGQSLCIIEAMKLMNDVESEFRGTVTDILVDNGQPVEYGEPLFKIDVGK